jgi:hypothetical protein
MRPRRWVPANAAQWLLCLFRAEARRIADHHLGQPDDGIERGTQLVAHAGEKLGLVLAEGFQLRVQAAELLAHPVDVSRQRTGLVAIDDVNALGEVAGRDLVKLRFDLLDRSEHRPGDGVTQRQRQRDAAQRKADHDPLRFVIGLRARLDAGDHIRLGLVDQLIGQPLELVGERGRLLHLGFPRLGGAAAADQLDDPGHHINESVVIAAKLFDQVRFVLGHEFQPIDVVAELVELAQRALQRAIVGGNQRRRHAVELARGVVLDLAIGLDLALQLDQLLRALVDPAQLAQGAGTDNNQQRHHHQKGRQ